MPRYFIDTNDDDLSLHDELGEEHGTVDEARKAALRALPDMAREKMPDGDFRTFCACVRDESGNILYKATLTLMGEWRGQSSCTDK